MFSDDLTPLSQYAVNIYARRDGTAPAAGVLTIDLADVNGTVINDENGAANSFTINLTTLTTSYASYTGVFRTPVILPSDQYIRLHLTTALTDGRNVYFDKMAMDQMSRTYRSGPHIAAFAGSNPFANDDYATVVLTNSRGSGGTLNTFQTVFARLFPREAYGNELQMPSSANPTISDSALIA